MRLRSHAQSMAKLLWLPTGVLVFLALVAAGASTTPARSQATVRAPARLSEGASAAKEQPIRARLGATEDSVLSGKRTTILRAGSQNRKPAATSLLVRFKKNATSAQQRALIRRIGGRQIRTIPHLNTTVISVPTEGKKADLARLDASQTVVYAEPNGLVHIDAVDNDPFLNGSSWQLANPNFPAAWAMATCSPSVVVAVLDTGVFEGHPDLGPIAQGYNFVSGNTDTADDNGHGTGVAGIIAGLGNNGIGIAGACWGATILPVKVLAASGQGSWDAVAAGIVWATDHGANIINMSLGATSGLQSVADAISYAEGKGVIVVAAAGNNDTTAYEYPAAYPGVVSVGAVDKNNVRYSRSDGYTWGSDYGSWVALDAPGCTNSLYPASTDYPNGTYSFGLCGTSVATPYVSGLAALALSYRPSATAAEVAEAIESTAHADTTSAHGFIDAVGALEDLGATLPSASFSVDQRSGYAPLAVSFTNTSQNATSYAWSFGDGTTSTAVSPSHIYTEAGTYTVTLTAANATDTDTSTQTISVQDAPPETTIESGPSGLSKDSAPSFSFSSSKSGSTFECSLDGGSFSSCTSPYTSTALADGAHTFSVRASDPAGNTDATPATRSFTVDTVAPQTTIESGPSGLIKDSAPSFSFSASETGSSFQCSLDGADFSACTSPYTSTALVDGAHSFSVRASDPVGNTDASPATRSFTVDTTPPQTTIESGPSGLIKDSAPSFSFSASESGSTFECSLDGGDFSACTSPYTSTALADGAHTFSVRAGDPAGNTDATPATRSFTLDTTSPQTTIEKSSGKVFAHLTNMHFRLSQAGKVKLVYRFSPQSKRFGYVLSIRQGARWLTVRRVKSTGRFQGSHEMTTKKLFARKLIKIGRYRLKLSADTNQKVLTFKVE